MRSLLWATLMLVGLAACHPSPTTQSQEQQPVPGQMPRMGY
ncbi:hypothetical protein [Acidibrevibacterium fodinaquatile]|nr:hypothetical protein [Acidibrevibacterium fodinaquatile]